MPTSGVEPDPFSSARCGFDASYSALADDYDAVKLAELVSLVGMECSLWRSLDAFRPPSFRRCTRSQRRGRSRARSSYFRDPGQKFRASRREVDDSWVGASKPCYARMCAGCSVSNSAGLAAVVLSEVGPFRTWALVRALRPVDHIERNIERILGDFAKDECVLGTDA